MGPLVWKVLGTGSAIIAGALANKIVTKAWEVTSGRPAPSDPTHPDDVGWKEAVLFAALTGLAVGAARVAVQRKAARYYADSTGNLPRTLDRVRSAVGR